MEIYAAATRTVTTLTPGEGGVGERVRVSDKGAAPAAGLRAWAWQQQKPTGCGAKVFLLFFSNCWRRCLHLSAEKVCAQWGKAVD